MKQIAIAWRAIFSRSLERRAASDAWRRHLQGLDGYNATNTEKGKLT